MKTFLMTDELTLPTQMSGLFLLLAALVAPAYALQVLCAPVKDADPTATHRKTCMRAQPCSTQFSPAPVRLFFSDRLTTRAASFRSTRSPSTSARPRPIQTSRRRSHSLSSASLARYASARRVVILVVLDPRHPSRFPATWRGMRSSSRRS